MRKVWTIAKREYGAMVATKAFLFSITLMPILMFGGILVANRLEDVREVSDKRLVIVDGTGGVLLEDLRRAADAHNAPLDDSNTEASNRFPRYVVEPFSGASFSDAERLALSNQIRNGDIEAFVEIPEGILIPIEQDRPDAKIKFYAQNAVLSSERRWLEKTLNEAVTTRRLEKLNIDVDTVNQATASVPVVPLGLFKAASDGSIRGADESRKMASIFVPFGFMMLMFMVIFLSAQPMLESVLEERSERIAEVLLGSASPFQLMFGKLLGNVAGSLSVVAIYGVGGYFAAEYNGWTDLIPLDLAPWFLVFQILAVLLYSSIFMAVGASVSQLKEAQTMLLPVWLVLCCPMFVWLPVVQEPNGTIATWMSFFPPATPLVMVLRLASETVIPLWQPLLGLVVLVAATLLCIFLAGRVFRAGILWQGKTPRLKELARWALRD